MTDYEKISLVIMVISLVLTAIQTIHVIKNK